MFLSSVPLTSVTEWSSRCPGLMSFVVFKYHRLSAGADEIFIFVFLSLIIDTDDVRTAGVTSVANVWLCPLVVKFQQIS